MSSTIPRDPVTGRFIGNWVVRGRVIRHIDPARPDPDRGGQRRIRLRQTAGRVALTLLRQVRRRPV